MSASSISVKETLHLLDGPFASLGSGVSNGMYALWLGSGISRGRVPGLAGVVERVLEFLRSRIVPSDPHCRYKAALDEALQLAALRSHELVQIDPTQPVASWPVLGAVIDGLIARYADLLDVRVPGEPDDYLLWDAVDVRGTYGVALTPDSEHLCIAVLALEGVLPDVATTNWDALVESAVEVVTRRLDDVLRVVVLAEDFRAPRRRTDLLKFHGCARLAQEDEAKYRSSLIGSQTQITGWPRSSASQIMRDALCALATTRPTLMIGLSAQDSNIQDLFADAEQQMPWVWPWVPTAHVFADDVLGPSHRRLLKLVYRQSYEASGPAIEADALLRAYAEQLLIALMLHVITTKLSALARTVDAPNIQAADFEMLDAGLQALRDHLAERAEPDRLRFVDGFIREMSRAMSLFREGIDPRPGRSHYSAVTTGPVDQVATSPDLATAGARELSAALGLLGSGHVNHLWSVSIGQTGGGRDGALKATADSGDEAAVFFVANGGVAIALGMNGCVDWNADDVVMIHSTEPVAALVRSPSGSFGRTGSASVRHVDMRDLLTTSRDFNDLQTRFRQEAAI